VATPTTRTSWRPFNASIVSKWSSISLTLAIGAFTGKTRAKPSTDAASDRGYPP
jgi:hypothetical protein